MREKAKKVIVSKFPLRLMPSVRENAENFSQKEGVSLNQFINVAVAEKLAHLQHEEWAANRRKPTPGRIARALEILNKPTGKEASVISIRSGNSRRPGDAKCVRLYCARTLLDSLTCSTNRPTFRPTPET